MPSTTAPTTKSASSRSKTKSTATSKPTTIGHTSSARSAKPAKSSSSSADTHHLSLRGSAKLVTEFFEYALNSILFQRGVYPPEDFTTVKKYGLNMMLSLDDQVKTYVKKIIKQLDRWMKGSKISKLVVVVTSKETSEVVERWQFDVSIFGHADDKSCASKGAAGDEENVDPEAAAKAPVMTAKTEQEIQQEIQSLFRQVTASVTFLPQLDGDCTFNVLVYADADSEVPLEWGDSDAREVMGGEKVQLRSFSTSSHRVDTIVSYRLQA